MKPISPGYTSTRAVDVRFGIRIHIPFFNRPEALDIAEVKRIQDEFVKNQANYQIVSPSAVNKKQLNSVSIGRQLFNRQEQRYMSRDAVDKQYVYRGKLKLTPVYPSKTKVREITYNVNSNNFSGTQLFDGLNETLQIVLNDNRKYRYKGFSKWPNHVLNGFNEFFVKSVQRMQNEFATAVANQKRIKADRLINDMQI